MGIKLESKIDNFLKHTCNGNYTFDFFAGECVFHEYNKEVYGNDLRDLLVFSYQLYDDGGYPNFNITAYYFGRKGKIEVYHIEDESDDTTFLIKDLDKEKFFGLIRLILDIDEDSIIQYITWDDYKKSARLSISTIKDIKENNDIIKESLDFTDEQLME